MPTIWIDKLPNLVVASGAQGAFSLSPTITQTQLRLERLTLIRLIIGIDIMPSIRDSGEGDTLVSLGIGVFSDEATQAGVFADPTVETDHPARGWPWRGRYRVYAVAADDQNVSRVRVDVDIRAARKLENGVLMMVVNNDPSQGVATPITMTGIIRSLFNVG